MIPPRELVDHIFAEPFRPFRIHMASGRTFDVPHPEFAKVGKSIVTVYSPSESNPNGPDRWQQLSIMLIESLSPIESSTDVAAK
jgi:hypothetical protein